MAMMQRELLYSIDGVAHYRSPWTREAWGYCEPYAVTLRLQAPLAADNPTYPTCLWCAVLSFVDPPF